MLHQDQIRPLQNSVRGLSHPSPTDRSNLLNKSSSRFTRSASGDDRGGNTLRSATQLRPSFFGDAKVSDTLSKRDSDYFKVRINQGSPLLADKVTFTVSNYSFNGRIGLDILDGNGKVLSAGGTKASTKVQPFTFDGFSYTVKPSIPSGVYYIRLTTGLRQPIAYDLTVTLDAFS